MAQRIVFQVLLVFVAWASVCGKFFSPKTFLRDVFINPYCDGRIYVITRQHLPFTKAKDVCGEFGGSLAKLGPEEVESCIKKDIIENRLQGPLFLIGEASNKASNVVEIRFPDDAICMMLRRKEGIEFSYVLGQSPCTYTGHIICQLEIDNYKPGEDPNNLFDQFAVSPIYKDRVYISSKNNSPFNLDTANEVCKKFGGYLVEFETTNEFNFLTKKAFPTRPGFNRYFIGVNDVAQEGRFVWFNSGKELSMTDSTAIPWYGRQPDNLGNEDCMEVYFKKLNDYPCSHPGFYVCEVPIGLICENGI